MRAAVDPRLDVRLGDDEGAGPRQEGAHLRRHDHQFLAAAKDPHVGIAQQAEARSDRIGRGVAGRQAVFAQAQEGEVVLGHPFEEGERFGDLVRRERRRVRAVALDGGRDAGPHAGPVADGDGHIRVDAAKALAGRSRALGSSMRSRWMWMKLSFTSPCVPAVASPRRRRSAPLRPARRRGSDARRGSARSPDRRSRRGSSRAGTACCR